MLSEIAPEEFAAALDAIVDAVLSEADWHAPPIDCLQLARRLGMDVAYDSRLSGRARFVNLRRRRVGCARVDPIATGTAPRAGAMGRGP